MLLSLIIGPYLPFLVGFSREDVRRLFPFFERNVWEILRETGYFHIQATKPDTAGEDEHDKRTGQRQIHCSVETLTEFTEDIPVFCNFSILLFNL